MPGCAGSLASKAIRVLSFDHVGRQASKLPFVICTAAPPAAGAEAAASGQPDAFGTAARLSFGLWDSIPDQLLWDAAAKNQLLTAEQVRRQAERMVDDSRTRSKLRDFLFAWLRIDHGPEIVKDQTRYSEFSPEIAADMRTSLELFVDDVVWGQGPTAGISGSGGSDFRRLFTDDEVYLLSLIHI